ncbi:MAG: hypothetical protein DRO11_02965, partial [Methanobacteriota archaeon]
IKRLGPDDPIPLDKSEKTNLSIRLSILRGRVHDELFERVEENLPLGNWMPDYSPGVHAAILGRIIHSERANEALKEGYPELISDEEMLAKGYTEEELDLACELKEHGIRSLNLFYRPIRERSAKGETVGGIIDIEAESEHLRAYGTLEISWVPGYLKLGDERLRFRLWTEIPHYSRFETETEFGERLILSGFAYVSGQDRDSIDEVFNRLFEKLGDLLGYEECINDDKLADFFTEVVPDYDLFEKTRKTLIDVLKAYGCRIKKRSEYEWYPKPGPTYFSYYIEKYFEDYRDFFEGFKNMDDLHKSWWEGKIVLKCEKPVSDIIEEQEEKIRESMKEDLIKTIEREIDGVREDFEDAIKMATGGKLRNVSCSTAATHIEHRPFHIHITCSGELPTPATPDADLNKQDEDAVEVTRALLDLLQGNLFDIHEQGLE